MEGGAGEARVGVHTLGTHPGGEFGKGIDDGLAVLEEDSFSPGPRK